LFQLQQPGLEVSMIETTQSVIPPLSEVKVIKVDGDQPDWAGQEGRLFRVGYYRKRDGLDRVWLVDDAGNYCKSVDQEMIKTHFDVVTTSTVTDLFGVNSPVIEAIPVVVPPTPWDRLTRKVSLVVILCTFPIFLFFDIHGETGRGRAVGFCTYIFITTIWLRWDLRKKLWFWIALGLLAAAHLPFFFLIRWSGEGHAYPMLIPDLLADFAVVYGPIRLLERAISRRSQSR
jgi:hypothetical protein